MAELRRSNIKLRILEELDRKKQTPTDLKKKLEIHRESISRALLHMKKQKIVECLNPDSSNYRYYELTKKGKQLLKEAQTNEYMNFSEQKMKIAEKKKKYQK